MLALVEGNAVGLGLARDHRRCSPSASCLVAFVVIERHCARPDGRLQFFRSQQFLGANIVAFMVSFAMLATFFFLALYMQNILGYSPLQAGVRFLPSTLVIIVTGPIAGRLTDRIGPRPLIVTGLLMVAVSLFWQSCIDVDTGYGYLSAPSCCSASAWG